MWGFSIGRTVSKPADPRRKAHKLSQAGRWKEAVAHADRDGGASEALLSEAVDGVAHQLMQVRPLLHSSPFNAMSISYMQIPYFPCTKYHMHSVQLAQMRLSILQTISALAAVQQLYISCYFIAHLGNALSCAHSSSLGEY